MFYSKSFGIAFVILSTLFFTSGLFAQEDVLKKRKDFMTARYDELKAIKRAVEEKDYATISLRAKDIMGAMDKAVNHFPKGSFSEKSRAKAEIWEKWDQFSKIPLKVKDVASALANAAGAKDEAGVQAQFKALGPESPFRSGACYECHKDFRSSPPPTKKAGG
ncbi:MAG: cytochrome c [Deltaproteobacteria bacterium]|nr:cytochrome c [Deltaproteobacteria bacterium]MDZ4341528.1 cytochrome c [Candidatus Binatia bacterium]